MNCLGLIDIYSSSLKSTASQVCELTVQDLKGSVEAFSEDDAEISSNKSRGRQELKADEDGSVSIKRKNSRLKKRCR